MSLQRRYKRQAERNSVKHTAALAKVLSDFSEFLEEKKQDDSEVRRYFLHCNGRWVDYCRRHKLKMEDVFKQNVAELWHRNTNPATAKGN